MIKVNVSTNKIGQFEGKWVAIDPKKDWIIAVGKTLKEISPLVTGSVKEKKKIKAFSFLVPRKDESKYICPSPIFISPCKIKS